MLKKAIYVILGLISALTLALCFIWPLTSTVSTFEGGRAFSRLFGTPVFFLGFLVLWFIDFKIFYKRSRKFLKYRIITFFTIIIVSLVGFITYDVKETNDLKSRIRNSYGCIEDVKDSFKGNIIDIKYQRLKIRKIDSNHTEFYYSLRESDNFDIDFYVGQKISKIADETEFEIILKDGSIKRYNIPCYQ